MARHAYRTGLPLLGQLAASLVFRTYKINMAVAMAVAMAAMTMVAIMHSSAGFPFQRFLLSFFSSLWLLPSFTGNQMPTRRAPDKNNFFMVVDFPGRHCLCFLGPFGIPFVRNFC